MKIDAKYLKITLKNIKMDLKDIKFKAFRKSTKSIHKVHEIRFTAEEVRVEIGFGENPYIDFNDIELLQFIGFGDKNNNEIYNGFILKYTKHPKYLIDDCLMIIYYDNERSCFGYKLKDSIFPDLIHPFSEHDELQSDILNHCEIIGNIYQNSELLSV